MMRTLAVTGGIGSGKSYVVRMFAALGVPVYDADTRTKDLYIADKELLDELETILGGPLVRNGVLDRKYMASRIFQDPALLSSGFLKKKQAYQKNFPTITYGKESFNNNPHDYVTNQSPNHFNRKRYFFGLSRNQRVCTRPYPFAIYLRNERYSGADVSSLITLHQD